MPEPWVNMNQNNEIIIYQSDDKKIEVSVKEETVWLSLNQIAELFDVQKAAISKHIKKIYSSGELRRESTVSILETVQMEGPRKIKRKITYYNLDVIISVGYRVNSKKATQFRVWATQVLKNYLIKGYAIHEKTLTAQKLKQLEKTIQFIKSNITTPSLTATEVRGLLEIIENYAHTWEWIKAYDSGEIKPFAKIKERSKITYDKAVHYIRELKKYLMAKKEAADIFGVERDTGLFKSALNTIYQTFDGKELYPSFEEKAANLLYLIIKNHPFVDGNKRIGALLFLMFMYENIGFEELIKKFNNNALTALCYLVAASQPRQKELMVGLITQMINIQDW